MDIGCGNGAYTMVMAQRFQQVDGIEIELERLAEFRRELEGTGLGAKIRTHEMDAENLRFPDSTFDVVTAIEVLEHIVDLDRGLREIYRVLRPGGALMVTCPNQLFPVETHSFLIGGHEFPARYVPFLPYIPPLHRRVSTARNFRPLQLKKIMGSKGFREVAVDYIMPPFDNWVLGRKFLRPLTERLERSPFKVFGVSIVGVYVRP